MGSSGLVRWGAIDLMLGGAVWVILGLSGVLGYLQAIPGREDVVLLIVALLLTAAGLVGIHALQGRSYGLLGRAGLYIAVASLLARALGAGIYLAGGSALQWISYPWAQSACWWGSWCTEWPPCGRRCCPSGLASR